MVQPLGKKGEKKLFLLKEEKMTESCFPTLKYRIMLFHITVGWRANESESNKEDFPLDT